MTQPRSGLLERDIEPGDEPPVRHVEVDLACRSFALSGIWEVDRGEVIGWQPPGQHLEGGTFILDASPHGTFKGDGAGTKTATFRLRPANDLPQCMPIPK